MSLALVALGSNLGDRRAIVLGALADLGRLPDTRLLAGSRLHETPPERPGDGAAYVNAAALLDTRLDPPALLAALLRVEQRWGRPAAPRSRGPRTLDLDLILYDARTLDRPGLSVPHPRYRERSFVLGPAAEVAPRLRDPLSGRTVAETRASSR